MDVASPGPPAFEEEFYNRMQKAAGVSSHALDILRSLSRLSSDGQLAAADLNQ